MSHNTYINKAKDKFTARSFQQNNACLLTPPNEIRRNIKKNTRKKLQEYNKNILCPASPYVEHHKQNSTAP
jgi:hypothetical protein